MVMVRRSRHTFALMQGADCFALSIPRHFDAKKWLAFCGSKSGREGDKFKALGLETKPARTTNGIIINCPGIHIEARILLRADMTDGAADVDVLAEHYVKDALHMLYFGEILDRYSL